MKAWIVQRSNTYQLLPSQPDLYPTVKHSSLRMSKYLREGRVLVRRQYDGPKPALACIGDVFGIKKYAVFAEYLLAEDAQDPVRRRPRAIRQELIAREISFESRLKRSLLKRAPNRILLCGVAAASVAGRYRLAVSR